MMSYLQIFSLKNYTEYFISIFYEGYLTTLVVEKLLKKNSKCFYLAAEHLHIRMV